MGIEDCYKTRWADHGYFGTLLPAIFEIVHNPYFWASENLRTLNLGKVICPLIFAYNLTPMENPFSSNSYSGKDILKYEIPNTPHWVKNQVIYS